VEEPEEPGKACDECADGGDCPKAEAMVEVVDDAPASDPPKLEKTPEDKRDNLIERAAERLRQMKTKDLEAFVEESDEAKANI